MSDEPMVQVERVRQFLCAILGRIDLALDPFNNFVLQVEVANDLRQARAAALQLRALCEDAERQFLARSAERLRVSDADDAEDEVKDVRIR